MTLRIDFAGEVTELATDQSLTFGRSADLDIDDNRYLHRQLGQLFADRGIWWLRNVGSAIVLSIIDHDSASTVKVTPGATVPITFEHATIAFAAGRANYELEVASTGEVPEPPDTPAGDGDRTVSATDLPLTPEQRLLLVVFAEPALRATGVVDRLPTNREVASRLGWSDTKFNRKLDALCRKYAAAGVAGLVGSADALARDRRRRLTEHVVYSSIVTPTDLDLLATIDDG